MSAVPDGCVDRFAAVPTRHDGAVRHYTEKHAGFDDLRLVFRGLGGYLL